MNHHKNQKSRQWLLLLIIGWSFYLAKAQNMITVSGDSGDVGPQKGSLVIVGGGHIGPEIWKRFIELAGGDEANIVVIPTASEDGQIDLDKSAEKKTLTALGVRQVHILHTRDPLIANTDSFVAPLKTATGVWFVGGRQWRIAEAYLNTKAQVEFNALLQRGGVIGGTSAGATIQGSFLLRGDTKKNTILEGDHQKGFDFIHHVAIDQHVLRRNRIFDLIGVVKKHPDLLGIGIDEGTAIVVHQNEFQVIGKSYVAIYDPSRLENKNEAPAPLASTAGPFYFLGNGQRFDLKARQVVEKPEAAKN